MPTIEIKQETLEFLQGLVKAINSQDNRCGIISFKWRNPEWEQLFRAIEDVAGIKFDKG